MTLNLTPAEARVLKEWAREGRLKGVARNLGLSAATVENHVQNARKRNCLENSVLLLVVFVRNGEKFNVPSSVDRTRSAYDERILSLARAHGGTTADEIAGVLGVNENGVRTRLSVLVNRGQLVRVNARPYIYKAAPNGNKV